MSHIHAGQKSLQIVNAFCVQTCTQCTQSVIASASLEVPNALTGTLLYLAQCVGVCLIECQEVLPWAACSCLAEGRKTGKRENFVCYSCCGGAWFCYASKRRFGVQAQQKTVSPSAEELHDSHQVLAGSWGGQLQSQRGQLSQGECATHSALHLCFLQAVPCQTGPRISQCGNHVDSKLFCPFDLSILSKARAGCNSKMSQQCANTFCSCILLISCSKLLHADMLSKLEDSPEVFLCHMQHSTGYAWWWTFESNAQTTWCCLFAAADQQASYFT